MDVREKGATPIILGDGKEECRIWAREAAEQIGAAYADTPRDLKRIMK